LKRNLKSLIKKLSKKPLILLLKKLSLLNLRYKRKDSPESERDRDVLDSSQFHSVLSRSDMNSNKKTCAHAQVEEKD
jgi:hypothetical protein